MKAKPEVSPHGVLTDAQVVLVTQQEGLGTAQHTAVLSTDRAALWGSLWVAGRGCHQQGEPRAVRQGSPNDIRQLKSKAAQREVPLHSILENLLDTSLPTTGRLFPTMTVDKVVKRYAFLRRQLPELRVRCSTPPASGSSPSVSAQGPRSTSLRHLLGITPHALPIS